MFNYIRLIASASTSPIYIIIIFLILAVLELIGLSMIPLFLDIALNPSNDSSLSVIKIMMIQLGFENNLSSMSALIIFIFGIKCFCVLVANYFVFDFSYKVMHKNRIELADLLIRSRYQDVVNKSSSEFINLIQLHINQSVSNYLIPSLKLISDSLIGFFLIAYLVYQYTIITFGLLVFIGLIFCLYFFTLRRRLFELGRASYQINRKIIELSKSIREGFVDISINGGVDHFRNNFANQSSLFSDVQIRSAGLKIVFRPLLEWSMVCFLVILVVANISVAEDESLLTMLVTLSLVSIRLVPLVSSIGGSVSSMKNSQAVVENYLSEKEFLKAQAAKTEERLVSEVDVYERDAEVNRLDAHDISFYYAGTQSLFRNVSFSLRQGEIIGIVGESGSGKTSLVSVLLGLLNVSAGSITFNGIPVGSIHCSEICSYVPQFPFIANDSLLNNIVFPGNAVNIPKIERLFDELGLSELKNGEVSNLDDTVGENGISLSGGQAQRIALIRAIVRNKPIIVIDEGTSALDDISSNLVIQLLKKIKRDTIVILVSHSRKVVASCDRVFELREGSLNEARKKT